MPRFADPNFPSEIELAKSGKPLSDYMDKDLVEHWDFYISKNESNYMESRYPKKTKEELQLEISKLQEELKNAI